MMPCEIIALGAIILGASAVAITLRAHRKFKQAAKKYDDARRWYEERLEPSEVIKARIDGRLESGKLKSAD